MVPRKSPRVVCVGVATWDALALVDRYPGADERVLAETMAFAGGGPAATAAVVLARQGVDVGFVGRVGDDAAGQAALQSLSDEGVLVDGVSIDPEIPTQTACVIVSKETATRSISTLQLPPLGPPNATAQAWMREAQWLHADQFGFGIAAAARGQLSGTALLSLDAGHRVAGLDLAQVDLFVPTMESLMTTLGADDPSAAAAAALAEGVQAVVATAGSEGATAWWKAEGRVGEPQPAGFVRVPAASGVSIASTLGAGDVFHGALLAALCRSESWATALVSANATAALSCRGLDGRSAIPTLDELRAFLRASSPAHNEEIS